MISKPINCIAHHYTSGLIMFQFHNRNGSDNQIIVATTASTGSQRFQDNQIIVTATASTMSGLCLNKLRQGRRYTPLLSSTLTSFPLAFSYIPHFFITKVKINTCFTPQN